jgi:hypothetical protein
MLIVVCGSRTWKSYPQLAMRLNKLKREGLVILSGGARGADRDAELWASARGVAIRVITAEWVKHGRAAGPMRNRLLLDLNPDLVLAFRSKGPSPGTDDMIRAATKRGIKVEVIEEGEV